jgi:hypothetical protein
MANSSGSGSASSPCDALAALHRAEKTAWRLYRVDFPWDMTKSLEFALFRTYAVPSISALLDRTNEMVGRPRKRYDDTVLIITEILNNGLDSPRARRAYARLNDMHGRFTIRNDDFLYVLSTFIFSPIDWIEKYGRRPLTDEEVEDWFLFWCAFGERMGIKDIFPTLARFRAFHDTFERARYAPSKANGKIAMASMNLLLADYHLPRFLYPLGYKIILALCEPHLVAALGFAEPSRGMRLFVAMVMRWRRAVLRLLPPNKKAAPLQTGSRTYPEGYEIEELGTFSRQR